MTGLFYDLNILFYRKERIYKEAQKAKEALVHAVYSNEPITIDGKKFECYTNKEFRAIEKVVHFILKSNSIEDLEELLVLGMKKNNSNGKLMQAQTFGLTYSVHFDAAKTLVVHGHRLGSPARIPIAILIHEDRIEKPYFLFHELGHVLCCKDTRFLNLEKKVSDLEETVADLFALYALCEINRNNPESDKESILNCIQSLLKKEPYLNHKEWREYGKKYFAQLQQQQNIGLLFPQKFDMLVTDAIELIDKRKKEKHRESDLSLKNFAKILQMMKMQIN